MKRPIKMTIPDNTPPALPGSIDRPLNSRGRMGRLSFAAWSLLSTILVVVAVLVISLIFTSFPSESTAVQLISTLLLIACYVVFLFYSFIFMIRRLHDRNHSGWLSLLFIVPLINAILVLYLLFAKGDAGANRFGLPRGTPGWEKVLGWMYLVLLPILFIVGFSTSMFSSYQEYTERATVFQPDTLPVQHLTHSTRLSS